MITHAVESVLDLDGRRRAHTAAVARLGRVQEELSAAESQCRAELSTAEGTLTGARQRAAQHRRNLSHGGAVRNTLKNAVGRSEKVRLEAATAEIQKAETALAGVQSRQTQRLKPIRARLATEEKATARARSAYDRAQQQCRIWSRVTAALGVGVLGGVVVVAALLVLPLSPAHSPAPAVTRAAAVSYPCVTPGRAAPGAPAGPARPASTPCAHSAPSAGWRPPAATAPALEAASPSATRHSNTASPDRHSSTSRSNSSGSSTSGGYDTSGSSATGTTQETTGTGTTTGSAQPDLSGLVNASSAGANSNAPACASSGNNCGGYYQPVPGVRPGASVSELLQPSIKITGNSVLSRVAPSCYNNYGGCH